MPIYQAIILAIVQGVTELLPVSSSAHVIVAAKFFHQDMSDPGNALLLVMLHTGTMLAVIVYFWRQWKNTFFSSGQAFMRFAILVFVACLLTGAVGYPIELGVAHILGEGTRKAEIEELFNKLNWIAPALAAAGLLIIFAGIYEARQPEANADTKKKELSWPQALLMGAVQGLAIPFRGFSRSGSTISTGLLARGNRLPVESFSFALAVAITPLAMAREVFRLHHAWLHASDEYLGSAIIACFFGFIFACTSGLFALAWLSRWLEQGRWYFFGIYCLVAAAGVEVLYLRGW